MKMRAFQEDLLKIKEELRQKLSILESRAIREDLRKFTVEMREKEDRSRDNYARAQVRDSYAR